MTDALDADLILSVHWSQSLIKHTLLLVEMILFSTLHSMKRGNVVCQFCLLWEIIFFWTYVSDSPHRTWQYTVLVESVAENLLLIQWTLVLLVLNRLLIVRDERERAIRVEMAHREESALHLAQCSLLKGAWLHLTRWQWGWFILPTTFSDQLTKTRHVMNIYLY